jgi:hypothetical protein
MTISRAFDLAQWVGKPVELGDALVVSALGAPIASQFKPVVTSSAPGVVVGSSVPAANAQGQSLLSGPGPGYAWGVVTDPAASASVPPPTATGQVLVSDATPSWQAMTGSVFVQVAGACMLSTGGRFSTSAKLTFTTTASASVCIDGGDPNLSMIDNFGWDAGVF